MMFLIPRKVGALSCMLGWLMLPVLVAAADQVPREQLIESHVTLTMHRLMPLGLACHEYLGENSKFPTKPSDLREKIGDDWRLFFASYDYIKTFDAPKGEDQDKLWAWIDKNSSFQFLGDRFEVDKLPDAKGNYKPDVDGLILERSPLVDRKIIFLASDGSVHFTVR